MAYEINAKSRIHEGTGASRRLRKAGLLPGVIYGAGKDAVSIELEHNAIYYLLQEEAFHSSIISLMLEGKKENVLVRDVQYHPWKQLVLHVDFQRVSADQKLTMSVPLHFLNEDNAPGVKLNGGVVHRILTEVEISCLPKSLPEFIEVDLSEVKIGQTLHLSDIKLGKGIELPALAHGEDLAVVSIMAVKGNKSEDNSAATPGGSAAE